MLVSDLNKGIFVLDVVLNHDDNDWFGRFFSCGQVTRSMLNVFVDIYKQMGSEFSNFNFVSFRKLYYISLLNLALFCSLLTAEL